MRKKKFFISIIVLVILFLIAFIMVKRNAKTYQMDLFPLEEITSVSIDSLAQYDNRKEFYDRDTIEEIYHLFDHKRTQKESINDHPVDPDLLFLVTFQKSNGEDKVVYIYKKKNKYYIEQPYNGIYKSSNEEFKKIQDFMA